MNQILEKSIPTILSGVVITAITWWFFTDYHPEAEVSFDIQAFEFSPKIGNRINAFGEEYILELAEEIDRSGRLQKAYQQNPLLYFGETWGVLEVGYIENLEPEIGVSLKIEARDADVFVFQRNDEQLKIVDQGVYESEVVLAPDDELRIYALRFGTLIGKLRYHDNFIRASIDDRYLNPTRPHYDFEEMVGWIVHPFPYLLVLLVWLGLYFAFLAAIAATASFIPSFERFLRRSLSDKEHAKSLAFLDDLRKTDLDRYRRLKKLSTKYVRTPDA